MARFVPMLLFAASMMWAVAHPKETYKGMQWLGTQVREIPTVSVTLRDDLTVRTARFDENEVWERYEAYRTRHRELLHRAQSGMDPAAMYTVGRWMLSDRQRPYYGEKDPVAGANMLRHAARLGYGPAEFWVWKQRGGSTTELRELARGWEGPPRNEAAEMLAVTARATCDHRLATEALDLLEAALELPVPTTDALAVTAGDRAAHRLQVTPLSRFDLERFREGFRKRCG